MSKTTPKHTIPAAASKLLAWYTANGRISLPWRKSGLTPYHIWVSEIMLQQTQVSRVVPYFERFIERFPTVHDLAASSWEEFLPYYQGLGYYARGRNMLKTAQQVVSEFSGQFPNTLAELRSLPGVGPYTAAAILSFGSGAPHLAFDTNQQRVWGRVLHGTKSHPLTATDVEAHLPPETPYQHLNAAVMDFANVVCLNRTPLCQTCPLRAYCLYFQTAGKWEPATSPRKSTFPARQAQTILVLHRAHQVYFSSDSRGYQPFVLPAPVNTRAAIKEYFARVYGLNLAVRPPHWSGTWQDQPTLIVNAQVLSGDHHFASYPAEVFQAWKQTFESTATPHER